MSTNKGPELLVDLAHHISSAIKEFFPDGTDQAEDIGKTVADRMAFNWGGQLIYVPIGMTFLLSQRNCQIYAEFNGTNHDELAAKYDVAVQTIYKIVKAMHANEVARRQRDLFSEGTENSDV